MAEIYRHQQAQEIGSVGSVEVAYSLVKSTLSQQSSIPHDSNSMSISGLLNVVSCYDDTGS